MKENIVTTSVEFDVVDKVTGEVITVEGKTTQHSKYYNIRQLTTRINQMEFVLTLSTLISNPKQLEVVAYLLDSIDADNKLVIMNQTKLADRIGCGRKTLSTILSNLAKSELAVKEDTGLYHINPYIYIGKRTRSNEAREQLQLEWPAKLKEFSAKKEKEPKLS